MKSSSHPAVEELLVSSIIDEFASVEEMHLNSKECLIVAFHMLKNIYTAFQFTSK